MDGFQFVRREESQLADTTNELQHREEHVRRGWTLLKEEWVEELV